MLVPAHSALDASVNWDAPGAPGRIEARYVRRTAETVVVYLSSQTGCRQACRMCWLTATGQTALRDVTAAELLVQAEQVLAHYRAVTTRGGPGVPRAQRVHFNFMARGEPLASRVFLAEADAVLDALGARGRAEGLLPRFLVSTILPRTLGDRALQEVFVSARPELYYSIYAMDERFRRRWLPRALPAGEGLDRLADWQRATGKPCKLHHAFIAGENDAEADVHAICDAVEARGLRVHVNVVRYNPFDPARHGAEPDEAVIARNAALFARRLPEARVKIIPRVGPDVQASCGMFVGAAGRTAPAHDSGGSHGSGPGPSIGTPTSAHSATTSPTRTWSR